MLKVKKVKSIHKTVELDIYALVRHGLVVLGTVFKFLTIIFGIENYPAKIEKIGQLQRKEPTVFRIFRT